MSPSANAGEYRSCPFCAEVIRRKAIRCKHCNSAIDPKKIRRYNRLRAATGWHLLLGLLLFIVVFVGVYPRVAGYLQQVELADRTADGKARRGPAVTDVAGIAVPKLSFGDAELVAGEAYNGGELLDLVESHFATAEIDPEKSITVDSDGRRWVIRTRKIDYSRAANYEITAIEAIDE